jgi:hypothetical protein
MAYSFASFYHKQMNNWLFNINGKEYPKYGIGRWRGENTLKMINKMEIGDVIHINGYSLKRIENSITALVHSNN